MIQAPNPANFIPHGGAGLNDLLRVYDYFSKEGRQNRQSTARSEAAKAAMVEGAAGDAALTRSILQAFGASPQGNILGLSMQTPALFEMGGRLPGMQSSADAVQRTRDAVGSVGQTPEEIALRNAAIDLDQKSTTIDELNALAQMFGMPFVTPGGMAAFGQLENRQQANADRTAMENLFGIASPQGAALVAETDLARERNALLGQKTAKTPLEEMSEIANLAQQAAMVKMMNPGLGDAMEQIARAAMVESAQRNNWQMLPPPKTAIQQALEAELGSGGAGVAPTPQPTVGLTPEVQALLQRFPQLSGYRADQIGTDIVVRTPEYPYVPEIKFDYTGAPRPGNVDAATSRQYIPPAFGPVGTATTLNTTAYPEATQSLEAFIRRLEAMAQQQANQKALRERRRIR